MGACDEAAVVAFLLWVPGLWDVMVARRECREAASWLPPPPALFALFPPPLPPPPPVRVPPPPPPSKPPPPVSCELN